MPRIEDLRLSMVEYIKGLSEWRRSRFNDDLRDPRHLRSADGLLELAEYIRTISVMDPRLAAVARLASTGELFVPGQQTAYELGRFHFHDTSITCDGMLTFIVALAERDAGESGRFGGPQVEGDDPWY
ncbi:hypothetical protein BH23CHL5_BH23CHL5_05370 [soil metagenome]